MRGFIGIGLLNTTATPASTLAEMRARQDYKTKYIGYWSGGHDMTKLTMYGHNKYLFGVKDLKDDPNVQGAWNGSPSKVGRWAVTYCPSDESSTRSVQILTKITYYTIFYDRNDPSDS